MLLNYHVHRPDAIVAIVVSLGWGGGYQIPPPVFPLLDACVVSFSASLSHQQ